MEYKSALDRVCDKHGCAKVCLDPKLREFDECFDYGIRMGDIDGSVERNGHILWLEWKLAVNCETFDKQQKAQLRQAIEFSKNSDKQIFVFVEGNPITMEIKRIRLIRHGKAGDWLNVSTQSFKKFLRDWFLRADVDGFGMAAE